MNVPSQVSPGHTTRAPTSTFNFLAVTLFWVYSPTEITISGYDWND